MPAALDVTGGRLPTERAVRKRWQIESMASHVSSILKDGDIVVEFCCGSGHLSLPLAYMHPECTFLLIDNNRVALNIGIFTFPLSYLSTCYFSCCTGCETGLAERITAV